MRMPLSQWSIEITRDSGVQSVHGLACYTLLLATLPAPSGLPFGVRHILKTTRGTEMPSLAHFQRRIR